MKITIILSAERPAAREHSSGRAIVQNTISEQLEIEFEEFGESECAMRVVAKFLKTACKRFDGEHAAAFDRAILDRQGSRPADAFDIERD